MADASVKVTSTTAITHISSGASFAAGAFSTTVGTLIEGTGNVARYGRADVVMAYPPSQTTSSTSMNIYLYRRNLNVGGTINDELTPTTANKQKFVGAFQLQATTSTGTQYLTIIDVPLPTPHDCEFYIENGLTPSIPAGWSLTVVPKTDVGATA